MSHPLAHSASKAVSSHLVFVSLSSFGADAVRTHGQLAYARICAAADADGVEIREELLVNPAQELPELGAWVRDVGIATDYSCPQPLFTRTGLNRLALQKAMRAVATLNASWLKISIGSYVRLAMSARVAALREFATALRSMPRPLLIENDQNEDGGSVEALQRFFKESQAAGLDLDMTFDMGNWHHVGADPLLAAATFAPRVRYIHVKGVQLRERWVAVPLAQSSDPWSDILSALPHTVPRAIEYPLVSKDLAVHVRAEVLQLRYAARDAAAAQSGASP